MGILLLTVSVIAAWFVVAAAVALVIGRGVALADRADIRPALAARTEPAKRDEAVLPQAA